MARHESPLCSLSTLLKGSFCLLIFYNFFLFTFCVISSRSLSGLKENENRMTVPQITQFSSAAQSCPTICDPMDYSMTGFPVHHQLLEPNQTHVHHISDVTQPSHPLSSPSPPAFNPSHHQGLFKWVSSSHQVAKVLEFQVQHQSFQWKFRTDFI